MITTLIIGNFFAAFFNFTFGILAWGKKVYSTPGGEMRKWMMIIHCVLGVCTLGIAILLLISIL